MLHIINWGLKRPGNSSEIYEAPFECPNGEISLRICNSTFSVKECKLVPEKTEIQWRMSGDHTVIVSVPPTGFNSIIEICGR
jgi:hypothetical protein